MDESRIRWPFVVGSCVALGGALGGAAMHLAAVEECSSNRADVACQVQALLMAVAFALGALALAHGCLELRRLAADESTSFSRLESVFAIVPATVLLLIAIWYTTDQAGRDGSTVAGIVPLVASALAIPLVMVIDAARQIARRLRVDRDVTTAAAVRAVRSLRRVVRRSLTHLGAYIAVSILAVGAIRGLDVEAGNNIEADPVTVEQSQEDTSLGLFVFGAFFTTLLAAFYVPAQSSVDRFAEAVLDHNQAIPVANSSEFSARQRNRESLEKVLGLGSRPVENLKEAVLVVAPLVSGISTIALPV